MSAIQSNTLLGSSLDVVLLQCTLFLVAAHTGNGRTSGQEDLYPVVLPRLSCAQVSPEVLTKIWIQIKKIWEGALHAAFPASSQGLRRQLFSGPQLEGWALNPPVLMASQLSVILFRAPSLSARDEQGAPPTCCPVVSTLSGRCALPPAHGLPASLQWAGPFQCPPQ